MNCQELGFDDFEEFENDDEYFGTTFLQEQQQKDKKNEHAEESQTTPTDEMNNSFFSTSFVKSENNQKKRKATTKKQNEPLSSSLKPKAPKQKKIKLSSSCTLTKEEEKKNHAEGPTSTLDNFLQNNVQEAKQCEEKEKENTKEEEKEKMEEEEKVLEEENEKEPIKRVLSSSSLLAPLTEEEKAELELSNVLLLKKPSSMECSEYKNIRYKNSMCSGKSGGGKMSLTKEREKEKENMKEYHKFTNHHSNHHPNQYYYHNHSSSSNFMNLQQFLQQEKVSNKSESWSKLNKTSRMKKVEEFVETYSVENMLTKDQSNILTSFLLSNIENGQLTKKKEVVYDKSTGKIKEIPNLLFIKANNHFTLKQNIFIDHSEHTKTNQTHTLKKMK